MGRGSRWALIGGLLGSAGCSPEGDGNAPREERAKAWPFEGQLVVRVADYPGGRAELSFKLETLEGSFRLVFDQTPQLTSGVEIGVSGRLAGSHEILVEDWAVLTSAGPRTIEQALIDAPPSAPKPIAALLVAPGGEMDSETPETFRQRVFTDERSTRAYFEEASYGIESLTFDVFGWFPVEPMPSCGIDHEVDVLAAEARQAAAEAGVDLSPYGQIMYYFPLNADCDWAGLAVVGTPAAPARDSWYNGSVDDLLFPHELGHNYGLLHSGSWGCGAVPWIDEESCTHHEYGDPFCPMGDGFWHMNAYQKAALGWLRDCNVVDVREDGSFRVEPLASPTNGIQTLRIGIGGARYLYVEYRQPSGFDFQQNPSDDVATVYQGVLVHIAPSTRGHPQASPGVPNLLDMTPGSRTRDDHNDAALVVGASYTSPAGSVTIAVDAADPIRAQVRVEFADGESAEGSTACLDGSAPLDPWDDDTNGDIELPPCAELPVWQLGTLESLVQHGGRKYSCRAVDLCALSVTAYEPGVGFAFRQAYRDEGPCEPPPSETEPNEEPEEEEVVEVGTGGVSGETPATGGNWLEEEDDIVPLPDEVDAYERVRGGRGSCSWGVGSPPGVLLSWMLFGLGLGWRRLYR